MVRAPIGHRSTRVIIPVAKEQVAALRQVINFWRLAKPEIPIEVGRYGLRRKRSFTQTCRQPHRHFLQFSQSSVADQLAGQAEFWIAPLLAPGLQYAFGLANSPDDVLAFINRERQWLLAVNILTGTDACQVHKCVPMVRCAHENDMNVVTLHYFAK